MRMIFCLALIVLTSTVRCFAGITSSPSLQKLRIGDSCSFRWIVSGSMNGSRISNQTTGSSNSLRAGTVFNYDTNNREIILVIWNVQMWDAGNYWLITNEPSSNVDKSAWLFVYGTPLVSIYVSKGTNPATEGDAVELTCNITSTSLPTAYRSKMSSTWYISNIGWLQRVSSGPATRDNGDPVPGHSIKNDGRTLVIDSVKYSDDSAFYCLASDDVYSYWSDNYILSISYRPYLYITSATGSRVPAIIGTDVFLSFNAEAMPPITSMTNWSFTDTAGWLQNLPPRSLVYYSFSDSRLRFNLTSAAYYGKYSITLTNAIGSTIEDFQVLQAGPPDTPSNVRLLYAGPSVIYVSWNAMHSNSINNYQQTVFSRLTSQDTGLEIDLQNTSFTSYVSNSTYNTVFQKNIQPNSNYEIRVWSLNAFGLSGVAMLPVRTSNLQNLNVSPETISINGNQATINFTLDGDDLDSIVSVSATCCSEQKVSCVSSYFEVIANNSQIVINDIPNGTDYLIDLSIYGGYRYGYNYLLAMAKCIKVSRDGRYQSKVSSQGEDNKSLLIAVIVLAVLLGIAVLSLIGICIASHCTKSRSPKNEQHVYESPIRVSLYPPNGAGDRTNTGTDDRFNSAGNNRLYEVLNTQNRTENQA